MAADNLGRLFCRRLRLILRGTVVTVLALAVLAPVLKSAGSVSSAQVTYQLEGLICHQESSRCIHIDDEPIALCSRCLGGYLGFLMASFLFSVRFSPGRRVRAAIAVLATAASLDIVLHLTGLYDTGNPYRLISGLLVGTGLGMIVFRFVSDVETSQSR